MKKVFVLCVFALFLLISCTNKYSETLGNYLQVDGKVKSDLKFELLKSNLIGYVTPSDSLKYYQRLIDSYVEYINKSKGTVDTYEKYLTDYNKILEKYRKMYVYEEASAIKDTKATIEGVEKRIEMEKENLGKLESNYKDTKDTYDYYSKMNTDKKLMEIVECTYKIFNVKKNIMEEITEKYAFSLDKKKCEEYDEE